jgi:tRNA modification GTPase
MSSNSNVTNTIFAIASATGRAGVAVVRISGPLAMNTLTKLMVIQEKPKKILPRRATYSPLKDPFTEEVLDNGLVIWFPGPNSFTGEDVVELQLHGGSIVISGILDALTKLDGLRMAEPGEFTRRAFENGKMDLTAAEGLADLIDAETIAQRRQSLRQLEGELGQIYESWRQRLLEALSHTEAAIDFSDEDLPEEIENAAFLEITALEQEIANHLMDNRRGERLRDGALITIIGPPNAGKSSLLNLLAKRDAAIVSETAGTTRDIIEAHLSLGEYPVTIADTAGLNDSVNPIEMEGIRRAYQKAKNADLKLAVFDLKNWPNVDQGTFDLVDADTLIVVNKCDQGSPKPPFFLKGNPIFLVSVLTGTGIDVLVEAIIERVSGLMQVGSSPPLTRIRHRKSLEDCSAALGRCLEVSSVSSELMAEDLRIAVRCLGRITGRVDVDDVLDFIFKNFCIGK